MSGPAKPGPGVLDAGVVLVGLDRRRRSHREAISLFQRSEAGAVSLWISAVNLAEALQHARRITEASGLDLVSFLDSFGVAVHRPDVDVARRVAALTHLERASLGDRFAAATALALGARLYTTDGALAKGVRKHKAPVSLF